MPALHAARWPALLLAGALLPLSSPALDLRESFQAAMTQDSDLLAARSAAEAGREILPMARGQLLPGLSVSYSRFDNDLNTRSTNFAGDTNSFDSRYPSENALLTLRQPLYRPNVLAAYQQAKSHLQSVEATLGKAVQDLALRVSEAYFNVILAEEGLRVAMAQQAAIAAQFDSARRALAAGQGTRTDIDEAQSRLDLNRAQELGARQQIDEAQHRLESLINQPVTRVSPLDRAVLQLEAPAATSLHLWIARAEATNPEQLDLKAQVETYRLGAVRARAGHKPSIDLIAQRSLNKSDNITNPDATYLNSQIGVQVSLSLYSGGAVNSQIRQAVANQHEAEQQQEAARRRLETEVRRQFNAVTVGVLKIRALEQAERSTDEAIKSNEKSFAAGVRSRLDILNAQGQRSQVLLELAQERVNYVLSHLRLLALTGGLNLAEISTVNGWLAGSDIAGQGPQ
jgi:outer membrane protein/protease secretion system outer membrane protein